MRIVKGRDYYDGAVGIAGRDPEIVFVRELRLMSEGELGIAGPERCKSGISLIDVIVAGMRQRCARVSTVVGGNSGAPIWRHRIVHDDASLDEHAEGDFSMPGELTWLRYRLGTRDVLGPRPVTAPERTRLIEHRVTTAIFDAHSCDAHGLAQYSWLVNSDRLKDYHLARFLDPFTCFQEIAMWVGGVLPRDPNPTVEITDDRVKAAKHGFDRFSFRKGKSPPRGAR